MSKSFGTIEVSSRNQWQAVEDALAERDKQDAKWGDQSGLPRERMVCALAEEVGEVAEAVLANGKDRDVYHELTQVAALALQMMEHHLAGKIEGGR